ncbi:hypothetical protein AB4672_07445 [Bacillus paralicheniformis]|uniref:hypothetical protein n=1 Tax=Bacillus paralicheniformis TaxID=1648923 RepID=UPI001320FBB6|nr:hypothetical protein CHCC5027_1521 [Bacillus paralicheniformis]
MSLYIKRLKADFQPFVVDQYVPKTVSRGDKKRHHHDASAFLKSDILFSKVKTFHIPAPLRLPAVGGFLFIDRLKQLYHKMASEKSAYKTKQNMLLFKQTYSKINKQKRSDTYGGIFMVRN